MLHGFTWILSLSILCVYHVKITTICWHCDPLLENEFRDAIQDNYFATYKFHFGLSMDQVYYFPPFDLTSMHHFP